jgi:ribose transport system substrate-binding protein
MNTWRGFTGALALAGLLAFVGCGDDNSESGSGSGASSGGNASADLKQFEDSLATAKAPQTKVLAPTSAPPVVSGKRIAFINCSATSTGCVRQSDGAKRAAKALGWSLKVINAEGSASSYTKSILSAVGAGDDGIGMSAVDQRTVGSAMTAANKAKIPVVSGLVGNPPGGDAAVYADVNSDNAGSGKATADWIIVDSKGKANVAIFYTGEFPQTDARYKGAAAEFAKCKGCKVVETTSYNIGSAATDIALKTRSVLAANPQIDYVWTDVGFVGALQIPAIAASASGSKVKLTSIDCDPPDVANIRKSNVQGACAAFTLEEAGWGILDQLNRAFNGESPADTAVPFRLLDESNLPPTSSPVWNGDYDYEKAFLDIWKKG